MAGDWPALTLGELCPIITDGAHQSPKSVDVGMPMASVKDLTRFGVNVAGARHISEKDYISLVKQGCKPQIGDVLIAKDGNSALDTVCTVKDEVEYVLLSSVAILRPDPERLNSDFLKYYFCSEQTLNYLKSNFISGAAIPRVILKDFKKAEITLPSLAEQKAIAHILGALDDKIELNRKMNETLEAMAQALFRSWFIEPTLSYLPNGWSESTLGEVAENPRCGIQPDQIAPDTPYIGLEHMPRRCIALSDWGSAGGLGSNKFEFKCGQILFGKLRPYFHKVGVAPVDGVCSTDILVIEPKTPAWFGFVLGHISSVELVNYTDAASTGTKMPRTNWKDISKFEVALPPESLAEKFTEQINPLIDRIIANIHESRTLSSLRNTLLPKLLSGELKVLDAEKMAEDVA
jgi:type I restriction enzyme S subunit